MINNRELKIYTEVNIEIIANIVSEVEKNLSKQEFGYFKSELGDYVNEIIGGD